MSTHSINIIAIDNIEPHPNADRLEIVRILGWQCCVGKGDFKVGNKAIYVPPDYNVLLSHPSFSFLKNKDNEGKTFERIRVRKFRKVLSQGLLIPVPNELRNLPVGTNVMEQMGIERWEPPIEMTSYAMFDCGPSALYAPMFDVENWQNFPEIFQDGETVIATEKLHGSSFRAVIAVDKNGTEKFFVGTRKNWVKDDGKNWWCLCVKQHPEIESWCRQHPGTVLYGELVGYSVQFLKYGTKPNELRLYAFAILRDGTWLDYDECVALLEGSGIPMVPLIYRGPFDKQKLLETSDGNSTLADHMREGIVIIPEHERHNDELPNGRVALKMVSPTYLEKGK